MTDKATAIYTPDEIRAEYIKGLGLYSDEGEVADSQILDALYAVMSYFFDTVYSRTHLGNMRTDAIRKWLEIFYPAITPVEVCGIKALSPTATAALERLRDEMKRICNKEVA